MPNVAVMDVEGFIPTNPKTALFLNSSQAN